MPASIRALLLQPLITVLLLYIVLLLHTRILGPLPGMSQESGAKRTFDVIGEGKVTATSTAAETQVTITEKGNTQKEAQDKANEKQNKAFDALKSLGFEKKHIKTVSYTVSPDYSYDYIKPQGEKTAGYIANITLSLKTSNLSKLNQAIDALPPLGINVGGIQFDQSNNGALKNQARQKAVEDAQKKAESLAQAAHFKVGKIATIKDLDQPIEPPIKIMNKDVSYQSQQTNIEPGRTEIFSRVQITYFIRN